MKPDKKGGPSSDQCESVKHKNQGACLLEMTKQLRSCSQEAIGEWKAPPWHSVSVISITSIVHLRQTARRTSQLNSGRSWLQRQRSEPLQTGLSSSGQEDKKRQKAIVSNVQTNYHETPHVLRFTTGRLESLTVTPYHCLTIHETNRRCNPPPPLRQSHMGVHT